MQVVLTPIHIDELRLAADRAGGADVQGVTGAVLHELLDSLEAWTTHDCWGDWLEPSDDDEPAEEGKEAAGS